MKDFLEQREDKYVREVFAPSSINPYTSREQYKAMLKRISSIGENLKDSLDFLDSTSVDVESTIEKAISTLETKLQVIRQSAKFITKMKFETRLISSASDISVIDISKGRFKNINYSVTDRGLVMDSSTTINLKE